MRLNPPRGRNPPPEPPGPGCIPGAAVLCMITVLSLCVVIPNALYAPVGAYYQVRAKGGDIASAQAAAGVMETYVWFLVSPLALLNLFWALYAVYRWRSERRTSAASQALSLPEDVSQRFEGQRTAPPEPSTHVQPDQALFQERH